MNSVAVQVSPRDVNQYDVRRSGIVDIDILKQQIEKSVTSEKQGVTFTPRGNELDMHKSDCFAVADLLLPCIAAAYGIPSEAIYEPRSSETSERIISFRLTTDFCRNNPEYALELSAGNILATFTGTTGALILCNGRFKEEIDVGLRDQRTTEKKISDFVDTFDANVKLNMSRIGFNPGENYTGGNDYLPVEMICLAVARNPDMTSDELNKLVFTTFLGNVGQLDEYPYSPPPLSRTDSEVLVDIKSSAQSSANDLASYLKLNFYKIFELSELEEIYNKQFFTLNEFSTNNPALNVEDAELSTNDPALSVEDPELSTNDPALSVEDPELSTNGTVESVLDLNLLNVNLENQDALDNLMDRLFSFCSVGDTLGVNFQDENGENSHTPRKLIRNPSCVLSRKRTLNFYLEGGKITIDLRHLTFLRIEKVSSETTTVSSQPTGSGTDVSDEELPAPVNSSKLVPSPSASARDSEPVSTSTTSIPTSNSEPVSTPATSAPASHSQAASNSITIETDLEFFKRHIPDFYVLLLRNYDLEQRVKYTLGKFLQINPSWTSRSLKGRAIEFESKDIDDLGRNTLEHHCLYQLGALGFRDLKPLPDSTLDPQNCYQNFLLLLSIFSGEFSDGLDSNDKMISLKCLLDTYKQPSLQVGPALTPEELIERFRVILRPDPFWL